jgi:hypothetical protein
MEGHLSHRTGAPAIVVSDERDALLETGGGVKKALDLFENIEVARPVVAEARRGRGDEEQDVRRVGIPGFDQPADCWRPAAA